MTRAKSSGRLAEASSGGAGRHRILGPAMRLLWSYPAGFSVDEVRDALPVGARVVVFAGRFVVRSTDAASSHQIGPRRDHSRTAPSQRTRSFAGLDLVDGVILLRGWPVGTYRLIDRPEDTFSVESGQWCFAR